MKRMRAFRTLNVYVSVKWVPGCSPIHSDILSDGKQAFSRVFGKRVMDGRTDRRTDGRTDFPCVLQDFVRLRGRRPAYPQGHNKPTAQQGEGTDDRLLPLGDRFENCLFVFQIVREKNSTALILKRMK